MSEVNKDLAMWDKILNIKTMAKMIKRCRKLEEEYLGGEETEDAESINRFFIRLRDGMDYKTMVVLVTQWGAYDDLKQAKLAIKYTGVVDASRFIILMDVLREKYLEGELV